MQMFRYLPLIDRLSRWPRGWLYALFAGLTLAVAVADWLSGERYTVYVLYFPIVALSCWLLGIRAAVVFSFFSSILWIVDDIFSPPEPIPYLAKYWQALTRFVVFVAFADALNRMRRAMSREYQLSHYDQLTGLSNRASLFEGGPRDLARCRRNGQPLTAIFIDLDQFKNVNDRFGHAEGDRVLEAVADCVRSNTRESDLIARFGGDEFVILAAEMNYDSARRFVERMQSKLRQAMSQRRWPVTFSIGAATFDVPPGSIDEVIKTADDLMYTVKRAHKDSIKHERIAAPLAAALFPVADNGSATFLPTRQQDDQHSTDY
jgi:diguanylate cyclase (GGDEF)-like protein